MLKRILSLFLLLALFIPQQTTAAQDMQPNGPVYVVESGDTFYSIAVKFGVTIDAIAQANPEIDPNFLTIGTEVVIPGLEGVRGKLLSKTIPLGETLRTLSIRYQVSESQLMQLNRITSPAEVYAGASLIIPEVENAQPPQSSYLLGENQSLFQLAVQNKVNPWLLAQTNQISSTWDVLPGEVIFDKNVAATEQVSTISPVVKELIVNPLPIQQGETVTIWLKTTQAVELTGNLAGNPLHFFPSGENRYVALQGIHAMATPGIYPLSLQGKLADGSQFSFEQMVILQALGYIQENIQGVDPTTIDPAVTKPEDDLIYETVIKVTSEKYWDGVFLVPGYDANWITSTYGNRRSYNGGPYSYFHTGVDYGGGTGLPIKSPAPGIVVFAGPLTVRGNATIIDHGWGVYSGFWHQSEISVKVGDRVEAGQEIGKVGGTGRITGPHLHWEIWVNGVQINPLTWLDTSFPEE
jgi:murein DD-endopeptidase MepM/ murein hydrolase activator NlpD